MRSNVITEEQLAKMVMKRVTGGVARKRAVVGVQVSERPGAAPDSPPSRVWVKPVSSPAPSPPLQSFTLYGQVCSGKNQVQMLWRNGKVHKYPNKTFTNWRSAAQRDILIQCGLRSRIEQPVVLTCHYTPGDLRTRDITGQLDAIFHLLVYAHVLKDDGLVHESHWYRLPMNRKAPKVTLSIHTLEARP